MRVRQPDGWRRDDVRKPAVLNGSPCSDVKTNGDTGVCSRCRRRFNYVVENSDLPCRRLCACRRGGQCDYRPPSSRRSDEPPLSSWDGAPLWGKSSRFLAPASPAKEGLREKA